MIHGKTYLHYFDVDLPSKFTVLWSCYRKKLIKWFEQITYLCVLLLSLLIFKLDLIVEPTQFGIVADFDAIRVKGFDSSTDLYTVYQGNKYTSSYTALVIDEDKPDLFYFSDTSKLV